MWITILISLIANLPKLIEAAKMLWDMISNLRSRKERKAMRVQMRDTVLKHCKAARGGDESAVEACRVELEDMYQRVAFKVSKQGPDDFEPDANEDEVK